MKILELRKLIREEVRKNTNTKRGSRLNEATTPIPLDSSITSKLVFIPVEDIEGFSEYAGDEGELMYSLFILNGPKTGVIVLKKDVRNAIQVMKDYEELKNY